MLDNLVGTDLSGISGYISYEYSNVAQGLSSVVMAIGFVVFLILVAAAISRAINGTKSQQYKNFLGDMWVAGKIKQLAEEDKIDLEKQVSDFKLYLKKNNLDGKSIAYTVEEEMQEKLQDKPKEEKKK